MFIYYAIKLSKMNTNKTSCQGVCSLQSGKMLFKRMKGRTGCIKVSKSRQWCLYTVELSCRVNLTSCYIKYRLHDPNNVARQEMSLSCDTSKATSTSWNTVTCDIFSCVLLTLLGDMLLIKMFCFKIKNGLNNIVVFIPATKIH